MRHPLTGGGMTVAFGDVVLLSGLLAGSSTGGTIEQLGGRVRCAAPVVLGTQGSRTHDQRA
jgi:hypothetical protein